MCPCCGTVTVVLLLCDRCVTDVFFLSYCCVTAVSLLCYLCVLVALLLCYCCAAAVLLPLIRPIRSLEAGQKIAPSIPVCRRCNSSPPRMPSQLVSFFLHGSSPRFPWPASPPLAFRVPTLAQSSRCCLDVSSIRTLSIAKVSLR